MGELTVGERCFPETSELGALSLDEVFLYHDGARLFSCRNPETGALYVAVWAGDTDGTDLWIVAPVPQNRLQKLKQGKLDVRQVFMASPTGYVYMISVPADPALTSVQQAPISSLTDELLPEPGERLSVTLGEFDETA